MTQSVNDRYLESLAAVTHQEPLPKTIAAICKPTEMNSQKVRALSPRHEVDGKLLSAISRHEFLLISRGIRINLSVQNG